MLFCSILVFSSRYHLFQSDPTYIQTYMYIIVYIYICMYVCVYMNIPSNESKSTSLSVIFSFLEGSVLQTCKPQVLNLAQIVSPLPWTILDAHSVLDTGHDGVEADHLCSHSPSTSPAKLQKRKIHNSRHQ